MALLEVSNLGIAFGGLQAVDKVDLTIEEGGAVRPDWPERCWKDDSVQHAHGCIQAHRGAILS